MQGDKMKVVYSIFVGFIVSFSSVAMANPCGTEILKIFSWQDIPYSQCIQQNHSFLEAQATLCTSNGNSLSKEYSTYRDYETRYETAMKKYVETRDPQALYEAQDIKNDWSIFGYRAEMSPALNLVYSAEFECSPRSK